ncbi:MAG: hypothetical protein ABJB11_02875 [Ferruginibacter sp.]
MAKATKDNSISPCPKGQGNSKDRAIQKNRAIQKDRAIQKGRTIQRTAQFKGQDNSEDNAI